MIASTSSHIDWQVARATAQTKTCPRVCLPNADKNGKRMHWLQHCISVMRTELLKLVIFAPIKLIIWRTKNVSEIPHYAYI